jgi:DNA repair exonuclease SbcCD ATPase subunit
MKIKEFLITRYGPLKNKNPFRLADFNLFWGKNEDGKTLTIDALVKLLLGINIKDFEHIDRVEENPEGYVIMEDDKGKEIKIPEKGDLTKITDLTSSECRNIFIIRNSDLSIAYESKFYTNVTDRLTGLRTEDISSIRKKLQEIGKLTRPDSDASLSDDIKWGKMKTKVKKAEELIENIDELKREIKDEKFNLIEEEISKTAEKIKGVEQEISNLENAQKREMYEKGDNLLKKLKIALKNLKGLNLEEKEKLKLKLDNYEEKREKLLLQNPISNFLTKATIFSTILLLASIFGFTIRPLPFLSKLIYLFIFSTVILGIFPCYFAIEKVLLAITLRKIKISALQIGVGGESIKVIRSNINSVDENLSSKDEARIKLDSYFGRLNNDLEKNILFWDQKVDELKEYKNMAKEMEYDENRLFQLRINKKDYLSKKDDLQEKMESFRDDLKDVEKDSNRILLLEDEYLHCNTSVDLDAIRKQLKDFINKIENNKDNALDVITIFEKIETEEKEKVSELFGKGSSVSRYFKEITGGLYKEVFFNQNVEKIAVKDTDRKILEVGKLSGGTYDQLYLSVRLALGEKLLKGKKGFFILDDPFVKADPDRLQRQIEILKRISELGWQIVYFSAKGEVMNILKKDIENGTVNYIEVQSIYA